MSKNLSDLRYGGRKSGKLVRCYWKEEKGAYRVEVELHRRILTQYGVVSVETLANAAKAICPKHLRFADIDWEKLRLHLATRERKTGEAIFKSARKRAKSMRRVTKYLRQKKIPNVHRFLVPLAMNDKVSRALDRWARNFKRGLSWEKAK